MRSFAKIVFIVVLLAGLVGISYVKSLRDKDREQMARESGKRASAAALAEREAAADSLEALLEAADSVYSESLATSSAEYARSVDSLTSILDSQGTEIAELQAARESLATLAATPARATKSKAAHKDILAHYRKEVTDLPADLSAYERRVALKEIRVQTAQKFAITVKRLNEIRNRYKIDY